MRQATFDVVGRNGRPPCQLPSKGIPSNIYKGLRGIDSQVIKFDCLASNLLASIKVASEKTSLLYYCIGSDRRNKEPYVNSRSNRNFDRSPTHVL